MLNDHHKGFNSIIIWCIGQVNFILSITTSIVFLEFLFKILSIVSVLMVIVINLKSFTTKVREYYSYIKGFFKKKSLKKKKN